MNEFKSVIIQIDVTFGDLVETEEYRGYLIDDKHAAYFAKNKIYFLSVKPTASSEVYLQDRGYLIIGRVDREDDESSVINDIITRLHGMNGYEFFVKYIYPNVEIDVEFDFITEDTTP